MKPVARLNDPSDHGGHIITASEGMTADGIGIARRDDLHFCPIPGHGVTPLVGTLSPVGVADGRSMATVGTSAGCGARISAGSPVAVAEAG